MARCTKIIDEGTDEEGVGLYLEAQTGVAPSQSHVFPLPKNQSVEWTEWFRAFQVGPSF